jgi:branched-chain amino acid transport system substrate-binding protein
MSRTTVILIALVVLVIIIGAYIGYNFSPKVTTTLTSTTTSLVQTTCPFTPPDKIVIGLSLSLTGAYALAGQQGLWGMQAAVNYINNVQGGINLCGKKIKIELKYYDDQSSKDLVPSLYERLITVDKVDILLGPYGSPLTLAAAPVAEKYGKLLISWMANSDKLVQQGFKFFVMVPAPASTLWKAALDMIKHLDPNATIAILYKEDEFNTMVAYGAKNYTALFGLKLVYFRSYPTDITDFTPLFNELVTVKPDVILICSHEKDGMLAMQQLIQLKIRAKLIGIAVAVSLEKCMVNL